MTRIYGRVETIDDISRINCIIRDEMLLVDSIAQLTELKKRSDYLCTLTYSPFWKKKFGDKIEEVRQKAIEENHITVKEANIIAKYKGFDHEYQPWGKEKFDVSENLKQIPEEIKEEVQENLLHFQQESDVISEIRKVFCNLRAAILICEDRNCLDSLKKYVDILSALPDTESFKEHFDQSILSTIIDMIDVEKKRTVKLMNILGSVKGINDVYYEGITQESYENANDFIKKLLVDENKSETYIPTEVRYKGNAKVLWLTYFLPSRKRNYAKRLYFPADFKLLKVEGPGFFKNKFGREIYGVKITYESTIEPTTIHVRGHEIHLPERIVKRYKVIPIPEIAQNIRLTQEKPASAMDIA